MDVLFSILGSVAIVGAVVTAFFRVIRPVMNGATEALREAQSGNADALTRLTDCQSQLAETLQAIRDAKASESRPLEGQIATEFTDLVARVESLERRIEEIHQQAVSAYRRAAQARRDAEKRSRDYGEEMEALTEEERQQAEQLGLVEPSQERQGEVAQDPAVDELAAIRARIRGER